MTAEDGNTLQAGDFDCGDGVPALSILPTSDSAFQGPGDDQTKPTNPEPQVSVKVFALAASVLTQIVIGVIIALGGNAVVGAVAAVTILLCSLLLVIAEAIKPGDQTL